ncbi:MAG: hypothetical protein Q9161_008719 [Pseudevernia consocians]
MMSSTLNLPDVLSNTLDFCLHSNFVWVALALDVLLAFAIKDLKKREKEYMKALDALVVESDYKDLKAV